MDQEMNKEVMMDDFFKSVLQGIDIENELVMWSNEKLADLLTTYIWADIDLNSPKSAVLSVAIERLKAARLDAADALAENDIEHLRIKRDGDAYLVHLDNFVDLQESPAVFLNGDSWQGKILSEWWEATPLIHLPFIELIRIVSSLREYREAEGR